MDQPNMKAYKIGDVAKILGISADSMRYYEKMGIVKPYKGLDNDYRYYEAWDINFIIECLWFKQFGFKMRDIAKMVSSSSYADLESALAQAHGRLENELEFQKLLLARLDEQSRHLAICKDAVGIYDICNSPSIIYYLNRYDYLYDDTPEVQQLSKQWLPYLAFGKRFFYIGGSFDSLAWGFSMDNTYASSLGLHSSSLVSVLPESKCIHTVLKLPGKYGITPQAINDIANYAIQHGHKPLDYACGQLLCSALEDGCMTGYFELWLPVEE